MDELVNELAGLHARLDALEAENAALRVRLEPEPAAAPSRFDRRSLLRMGGVAAAAGAGVVLMRPASASATTGNFKFGDENDAGSDATSLDSMSDDATLALTNDGNGNTLVAEIINPDSTAAVVYASDAGTGGGLVGEVTNPTSEAPGVTGIGIVGGGVTGFTDGSGPGVGAIADTGTGPALLAIVSNADSNSPAVEAIHEGLGNAVYARVVNDDNVRHAIDVDTTGSGHAVLGTITNTASTKPALRGETTGAGAGIEAKSAKGTGGKFTGKTAQIYLVPSTATTHPRSGTRGQLFVDKSGRLWFCKGSTSWKQLA